VVSNRLDSLSAIEAACWHELVAAADDRAHEWRVMTLATVDRTEADARAVVIREADADERTLSFFTDSRSPKVAQICAHPRGLMLAWSQRLSWQLRLRVVLEVDTEGLEVSSRWARLKLAPAAQDYLSPLQPAAFSDTWVPDRTSRSHFAVVTAAVEAIDWLELHAEGHRRARFDAGGARWLAP
jgi:hypothetical protein